jgi:hypothetical protein
MVAMTCESGDGDDVVVGPLIRLADVPKVKWLPIRNEKRVSLATVHRWAQRGLRGVKLRTLRAGGALFTTECWLLQFFEALSEPTNGRANSPTPRQRKRALERAQRELEAAGF